MTYLFEKPVIHLHLPVVWLQSLQVLPNQVELH